MDFISQLPLSNGYNAILVITTCTSLELADLFIKHVFLKHGLPDNIVSNHAHHPEDNGQTERVNQILEKYLQMFICYQQDDWSKWLPMAEFAYKNVDNLCFKPFTGEILSLTLSIQRYKQQADKLCLQPPSSTSLFQHCKLGLFKIESVVSKNALKLSLPSKWKEIHPVFHVSLLEPAKGYTKANYNISSNGLVISLTKIELPGNPPTIFETPPTWFKTFIPLILTNLINLKSPSFKILQTIF
ncbi:uncharacterized protein VP01_5752g1 [Puccinia sorghi]|uniref:Tf2-1-like SH3-like domain-containing protein n=1 Tax=Puccinia sorghi TaxID=27349 RepID=A0A0L6UKI6_9BASI|nr:uncharacterized protein VP01_5752g1 [Puccinia sorghi]